MTIYISSADRSSDTDVDQGTDQWMVLTSSTERV